jgi:predicted Ser/Thr protein kinase
MPNSNEAVTQPLAAGPGRIVPAGLRFGKYRLLGVLGEGGMGCVYEAEQDRPRRSVALKIIRHGLTTDVALRRFEAEAELLGRLHHPGVAQVYEAGTADTPSGPQPYFAMELVRGRPLTQYANDERLDATGRLELLARVCDAVQHAHNNGIIHRDLKPGNILVEDATRQPKVLDFGVARLTEAARTHGNPQTIEGQIIGTLEYMSPEQACGQLDRLDARSDVYTLGIIGYELLAGRRPYEVKGLPLPAAARVVCDAEPGPLRSADHHFRGDIETIVSKALEKDPGRRYPTAADLAEDIRRHMRDEPLAARPASALYCLAKFARRRRALVGGVAAACLALAVGTGVAVWQASRAMLAKSESRTLEVKRQAAERAAAKVANEERVTREKLLRAEQSVMQAEAILVGLSPGMKVGLVVEGAGSADGAIKNRIRSELALFLQSIKASNQFNLYVAQEHGAAVFNAERMVIGVDTNRHRALEFFETSASAGGSDLVATLDAALRQGPQLVYIILAGNRSSSEREAVLAFCRERAAGGKARLNAIAVVSSDSTPEDVERSKFAQAIALAGRGVFKTVKASQGG